ncbi:MAG TPA: CBS domain-containing protein [Streptosporangiaceae bacterium]|nr:CBS domain-containing protein [Streptosporangiaceae bacterium]
MPHTDVHLDAMLRHLGAAYYRSLRGDATHADVTRALDTVEEQLTGRRRPRGWDHRVRDVMRRSVVTVHGDTSYKEIARLLAEHQISGLPVLGLERKVVGVVTEDDLLAAQARTSQRLRAEVKAAGHPREVEHPTLNAAELMTTPAVTIGPEATVPAAARLMNTDHLRMLPVTDDKGRLLGIVTRRELLSVFLRADGDIASDIRQLLTEVVSADADKADVTVQEGVVTLTGELDPTAGPHGDLIPVAIRLMWSIDGVVDVIDRLGKCRDD